MLTRYEELAPVIAALPKRPLKVTVLTSCTGVKGMRRMMAEELYQGEQHRRLMMGVATFRASSACNWCHLSIVSARWGIIPGGNEIAPYDVTFSGLGKTAIRRRARELGIPSAAQRFVQDDLPDLKIMLLGNDYLEACNLIFNKPLVQPTILFCSTKEAMAFPRVDNLYAVGLNNEDARRQGVGLIALKGELTQRLLEQLAQDEVGRRAVRSSKGESHDVGLGAPQAVDSRAS
jgi:hypothetical protein